MVHFAVATKAAIIKNGRVLVLRKTAKESSSDPDQRLDLPGGRLEFGEHPHAGLLREVREEVNLRIEVIQPAWIWHYVKNDTQLVGITFYCRYSSGEVSLSAEHERFEWLTFEEIVHRSKSDIEEFSSIFKLHALLD